MSSAGVRVLGTCEWNSMTDTAPVDLHTDTAMHPYLQPLLSKSAFDKVLSENYMNHAELVSTAVTWLNGRWNNYGAESQAFLDLGCGDGQYLVRSLVQSGIVSR